METPFFLHRLKESDLEAIIKAAGGKRLSEESDGQSGLEADFQVGDAIIELKSLDEEALEKPERQSKLASIFRDFNEGRPVIVLDRAELPEASQRAYDRALEGPIKTAVAKARRQLKQSRVTHPSATCSILFLINNGYTALDHHEFIRLATHRVRQDTGEIDGIIVAGCYYYSDSFDYFSLWPIEYIPIKSIESWPSFEQIREAWNGFAEITMTALLRGESIHGDKGPVIDLQFEVGGVTYVKPAPPMGTESGFFEQERPRMNSRSRTSCPPIAITHPQLTCEEWERFRAVLPDEPLLYNCFEAWQEEFKSARSSGKPLTPFVSIPITCDAWKCWCEHTGAPIDYQSMFAYANELFSERARSIVKAARERKSMQIVPSRYVFVLTEVIGQDKANDVSHIGICTEDITGESAIQEIAINLRAFHEWAVAIAAAYVVREGLEFVLWGKNLKYAWW